MSDPLRFVRAHRAFGFVGSSTFFGGAGPLPAGVVIISFRMIMAASSTASVTMGLRVGLNEALDAAEFGAGASLLGRGGISSFAFPGPSFRVKAFSGISARVDFAPYWHVVSGPVWVNLALRVDTSLIMDGDFEVVAQRVSGSRAEGEPAGASDDVLVA